MRHIRFGRIFTYFILTIWSLIALFPIWTLLVNSFKIQKDISAGPFGLPNHFTFAGYITAWTQGRFDLYFYNTIYVTVVSLALILFLGSLAAYALAKWKSRVTSFLYVFFIAGMMIPIRLGTIDLVRMMKALNLLDTLWSLIPVYVAMGMPIATFVLTAFIQSLPDEMFDAARGDGASAW